MRKHLWAICYSALLIAFTTYTALDTFVLTRVYSVVDGAQDDSVSLQTEQQDMGSKQESNSRTETSGQAESGSVTVTGTSYVDDNIQITLTEYREHDTSIYVADIILSSPEYLQTAFAQGAYGKNVTEKTSEIAADNHAILAINGDYYGAQEDGYVLKNGVLYRDSAVRNQEDLVIYADGSFEIISESNVPAKTLLENGAVQILSFGPALVQNGSISISEEEEVGKAKASNPRTAIAVVDDLHYLFIVSDGRTDESEGLSLYELAVFAQGLGAKTVYNLDGGGSSTMVFNGEVINQPTSSGRSIKERSVSDIVYIGY